MPSSPCFSPRAPTVPPDVAGGYQPLWWSHLTPEWRAQVVAPYTFRLLQGYQAAASRVLGCDEAGRPCFCAHGDRLTDLRWDGDEAPPRAVAYSEALTAWRLVDGRWLIHRRVEPLGAEGEAASGFSIVERMPR